MKVKINRCYLEDTLDGFTLKISEEVQVDISEDLSITVGGLNAIIASTLVTVVYRKWSSLLVQLMCFKHFGRPTTFDDVAYNGNLVAALYTSYVTIGVVLYGIVAIFKATACRKVAQKSGHRVFCGTYTPIWLPFDMDTRIIYVMQFFFTSFIPIPSAVLCFMFVQVAELIISHLSYLKEHLEFVFDEPNANLRAEKLRRCVCYHQFILSMGKQLNYLVKYNVGFISSSWALIFGCIANQIAKSMNFGAIIFLCGYMVALFCFSYAGQRLKDESMSIADVLYKLDWYTITAYEQRNVLYMIVRSQYPLILDASPLGNYGYPLFLMIVKTAYSFLTLLQNSI